MSRISISVRNQTLRLIPGKIAIVSGSQDFVRFHFELDSDWKKLTAFAQFTQGENSYNAYLDENHDAYLPPEITTGACTLMDTLDGNNNQGQMCSTTATNMTT